ncbi:MAG: hypothetical protein GY716_07350 [bacterium]|nr:hypothetical protein [bacterium]
MTKKLNQDDLEKVTGAEANFAPPEDGPAPRNWGAVPQIKRLRKRSGMQQPAENRPLRDDAEVPITDVDRNP